MAETPAYWLSALAEELALLAENRDAAGVTAQLRAHAHIHAVSEKDLTAMVAAEWARMGIVTVPSAGILRGWIDA
jgi:hypothetical protein